MAEVATTSETPKASIAAENPPGLNLLGLTGSRTPEKEIKQPSSTVSVADLGMPAPIHQPINLVPYDSHVTASSSSVVLKDSPAWRSGWSIHDIYEDGLLKVFSNDGGKSQFGIKVGGSKDHGAAIPTHNPGEKRGVSLQFRLKF
jgi:hypothetical protein